MSVRPKKRLGQHFLHDESAVRDIVLAVDAPEGAAVVEIGPGEGALTEPLLARYPELVALEVDAEALAHLAARFPALDLRQQDVLQADWSALANGKALHVVGNLPYYISSPILFALLDARLTVRRAIVMVQKEVADRIVSPPGSKVYGTLSVYFQLYARSRILFDVPPESFHPRPNVDSAVVQIDFGVDDEPSVDFEALRRTVRAAFGQRRKMLRNSLSQLAEETGTSLPEWAATLRPEAVSPARFVELAQLLVPR